MPAYKDKNNKWYISFRYQDWTGKNVRKVKRGFETRREALEWERRFLLKENGSMDMPFGSFVEIYKEDLKEILSQLIEKWQKKLNVTLSGWKIERMQVRWGSCCNAAGKALFNLELAKKPYHCVEYIVAHELAHLLEPTHNDRFHNILFAHLPNWENARKELNEFII